ncbi:MAG: hypothetical protein V3U46_10370 [Acidimicrobiia bacterium]
MTRPRWGVEGSLTSAVENAPYAALDRHIVFELDVHSAFSFIYTDDGTDQQRWPEP